MSKFVYRRGDVVLVSIDGVESQQTIQNRFVDSPDENENSLIHYVSQDGTLFTDDQIIGLAE